MIKSIKRKSLQMSAAVTAGSIAASSSADAAGVDFSSIASNVTTSIASLPGLLTALCYMFGILLGILGILKIKDHVENPSNAPLKDGCIRLAAGGALLAAPLIFNAMRTSIMEGSTGTASAAVLNKVSFNVQ